MNYIEKQQKALKACQKLTRDGKELRIDWSGGGDSGYYETQIGEMPVDENPDILNIYDLIIEHTGNWSFNGDYHSKGNVIYHPELQALVGEDITEESGNAVKACSIPVEIPKSLWFDRLNIRSEDWDSMNMLIELMVLNGPRSFQHALVEKQIAGQLEVWFEKELVNVEDRLGVNMNLSLRWADLQERGEFWLYVIKEIPYSFRSYETTELLITLTD